MVNNNVWDIFKSTTLKKWLFLVVATFLNLFYAFPDSGAIVFEELGQYAKAVSLTTLSDMVNKLPGVQKNLSELTTITNELRVSASQLNDGTKKISCCC